MNLVQGAKRHRDEEEEEEEEEESDEESNESSEEQPTSPECSGGGGANTEHARMVRQQRQMQAEQPSPSDFRQISPSESESANSPGKNKMKKNPGVKVTQVNS